MLNIIMTWILWREASSWLITFTKCEINELIDEYATDPFWNKDPQETDLLMKYTIDYIPSHVAKNSRYLAVSLQS